MQTIRTILLLLIFILQTQANIPPQTTYNQNNDLEYIIDQLGQKTEYRYQAGHLLEKYYDPSGLRLTKNIYDESGRFIQTIDEDGNVVEFTHNIDGKEEIVKERYSSLW